MSRILFHIDCNSAYLSWTAIELLKNGSPTDLRLVPSIIGGDQAKRHGVVLAKSIPAKAYGVKTGEPVAHALKKCPTLVIEPPDHRLYDRYSRSLMELLSTYTNDMEQVSVDETYLDFTPIAGRFSSPTAAAMEIKDRVRTELGFTVNIGIAPNKLLAKMASDFEKPDQVHTLFVDEIPAKLWPLPVRDLYMVGKASEEKLLSLGVRTIGDLAAMDVRILTSHFKSHGKTMWEYANGFDQSPVISTKQDAKGIGNSTTLSKNAVTREENEKVLLTLADSVSRRLREAGQIAKTVAVEIKYHDFTSCSHQTQFLTPINTSDTIYEQACHLFGELWNGEPVRLLGIRTSNLLPADTPVQMNLFDFQAQLAANNETKKSPDPEKRKRLDQAMDIIRKKYGEAAVVRGSFMKPPKE